MAERADSKLLARIGVTRAHAKAQGWADVVVELDQAEWLVLSAGGRATSTYAECMPCGPASSGFE